MLDRLFGAPVPVVAMLVAGFEGIEDWSIVTAFIAGIFTVGWFFKEAGGFEFIRSKVLGQNGHHRKSDGKVIAQQKTMLGILYHMREQHDEKLSSRFRHPAYQPDEEKDWGVESVILYQQDMLDAQRSMAEKVDKLTDSIDRSTQATLARVDALERLLGTVQSEFDEVKDMLGTIISGKKAS